ncbi:MAG: nitroreductase family protein [Rikenellaceae bacterium]
MKHTSQIINLLLAVALVVLAIKFTFVNTSSPVAPAPSEQQMGAIEAIMTRSSVRSYTSQSVEAEKIETMLRAAMAAPTAGNRQPWEFIVVTDTAILHKIPTIIKASQMAAKSQLAIVSLGLPGKSFAGNLSEYWVQDVSAANENLLLAAHSLGLGAVWCGAYPDQGGRVAKLQELLGLPADVYPLSVTVIGYPDSEPHVKDKWAPEKVSYNRYGVKQ